mmetsp:Transcript_74138/g.224736  ORF Transcript_74138/g.224736 Transcript_74138/m.224736 type:complete len:397 (-) Transcript_74138:60-1250(-)
MLPAVLRAVRFLVVVVVYLAVGCCFYMLVEEKPCESEERVSAPGYDEADCTESWTMVDSLYFSMVTMSTVGFGDFSPSTAGSKVFTCLYILVGITVVFTDVSEALSGIVDYSEQLLFQGIGRLFQQFRKIPVHPMPRSADIEALEKFQHPPGLVAFWARHLSFPLTVLVLFQFLSAVVFTACQDDLGFGDALYHCMVSATTVGYGDVSLTTQGARVWAFIHIALSVSWLAAIISDVGELKEMRRIQLLRVQMLQRQLDRDLIHRLDKDGLGVDRLEFVIGMLTDLGAELCGEPLGWAQVLPFLNQFEAADLDKSGRLNKEDLALMVEKRRFELGEEQTKEIMKKRVAVAAKAKRAGARAVGRAQTSSCAEESCAAEEEPGDQETVRASSRSISGLT